MRVIFMGTPEFALPALKALHNSSHQIVAVYTAPPKAAHRGKRMNQSVVHRWAFEHNLVIHTPDSLKKPDVQEVLKTHQADIAVVVAYGMLLPQAVLDIPAYGCINIHPSALPRWRGAAPVQRTIMAGDSETDICIMQMNAGLDTGDVLLRRHYPVDKHHTSATLSAYLADESAELLLHVLDHYPDMVAQPQSDDGISYAAKISKADARMCFDKSAEQLRRHVHGLSPFPGAYMHYRGERIKWLEAEVVSSREAPVGTVLSADFTIACLYQAIRPLVLQRAGKKPLPAIECLRGLDVIIGEQVDI